MKLIAGLLSLGAVAMFAAPAGAFQVKDGGVTAQEVAQVLQDKGYRAEVGADSTGDPKVESATDGTNFTIFFYGCNHTPRCGSIEFQMAFHLPKGMTADQINEWNRTHRFGRAYIDKVNDPFMEMDLDVEHGFLTEGLANNIDTWASLVPSFKKFINF
jgi:hypothetical protein